jgi:hypothetical protein
VNNWIEWLAAFLIVLAILSIGAAVQEYLECRKENRRRR